MRELTINDFQEFNLENNINIPRLKSKNIEMFYDQIEETQHTCIVKVDNTTVMQILTKNKETMLKWLIDDIRKYG